MTTKHKPATPLPWETMPALGKKERNFITNMIDHDDPLAHVECHENTKQKREADASYIAHAANAYPQLVEALRLAARGEHGAFQVARGLLNQLGEE